MDAHASNGKDTEKKHRGRLLGKFFKEKKEDVPAPGDVDDFLRGPSDKLYMMPTTTSAGNPPPLTKIDTSSARRWPTASEIRTRGRSVSPKRTRKGLVVRFSDAQPEVIGEGGDEATSPVSEISLRKRAHTHPPSRRTQRDHSADQRELDPPEQDLGEELQNTELFRPGPIRRTQTGFESISDAPAAIPPKIPDLPDFQQNSTVRNPSQLSLRSNGDRRSFADMVKAEMRSGEGLALVHAASHTSSENNEENRLRPDSAGAPVVGATDELHINTMNNAHIPVSPSGQAQSDSSRPLTPKDVASGVTTESPAVLSAVSTISNLSLPRSLTVIHQVESPAASLRASPIGYRQNSSASNTVTESPASISRAPTLSLQDTALAVGDDALNDFARRTAHLSTLFRLSTESSKPIPKSSLEDVVRAASWWFLKGRLNLEATVRDRPVSPQAQQTNFFVRQQAFTDLAKSLWLLETAASHFPEVRQKPGLTEPGSSLTDVLTARQSIISSLRKLTMSMKRNNFLPPDADEAPLTQGLDASIWVQDEGNRSLIASQRSTASIPLSEALPLGDTTKHFQYSRMFVEAMLIEEAAAQQYRSPALVSVVRGHKDNMLSAIIATQDGSLNLAIGTNKSQGATWDDVRWQSKHHMVDVNLPRGFTLRLHLTEQDFRILWNTYDYEKRTRSIMEQRSGEEVIFETTLRTFQYFDSNSQSSFPKDPQPHCHIRVFEKTIIEKAATGPRTLHRGFRFGLNTNSKTKNLRGIDQDFLPNVPTQFGFLRGEGGLPALLLKISDGKCKYTVVCTFDNTEDRMRLHALLTGVALRSGEDVVADSPIQKFSVENSEGSLKCLEPLQWESFRFVNYDFNDLQSSKTVLSEHLRIIIGFKTGTITDRINVEPGELKLRLEVHSSNELKVLRLQQQDLTVSVSESQVSKELPQELTDLLGALAKSTTTRTYSFSSSKELHLFQAALTGFEVLFDGVASSFNISRRRMVVPIYKKWDAAATRLQIVQKEKVIQLIAFFENFSHGNCMNFNLKSTDIFESSGRSGKFSLRIVDAKFALPKSRTEAALCDHEFVCLDMPEYPGEHDDITIVFDTEAERDNFAKALPAPTKIASRMGSVRR